MPVDSYLSNLGAVKGSSGAIGLGPVLVLLNIVAATLVFWTGLESLPEAWAREEYSHGYIIPFIAAYLFVRKLRDTPPSDAPKVVWPGLLFIVLGLAVGIFGNLARIPDISTYGMIVWIAGMVLTVLGWRRGLRYWTPVVYLVFMLPLPQIIYWQLSIKLQFISSEVGVGLISMFGVPVFLDGNVIDLGIYKLQVAEACSGLRYLFPLASFGFLFAVLYRGPAWHKVLLFLSTAPITVAMNSFRIGVIGVLVDSFGISQAEGFLHNFEGWIIFIACVAVLYLEAVLLQRLTRNPEPIHRALDIDFDQVLPQMARVGEVETSRGLIAATVLSAAVAVAWTAMPARSETVPDRQPLVLFPDTFEGWRGQSSILDPLIEQVLAADDYRMTFYRSEAEAAPVDFFVAFYESQTNGSGIHSPEVCIPSGGWEVSAWEPATVAIEGTAPFELNRAIIQKGIARQLVYYWFEQRGRRLANDYMAKAYTVWDSIAMGRSDGALVRVITPIGVGEAVADADARLQRFMRKMLPMLPDYIPPG